MSECPVPACDFRTESSFALDRHVRICHGSSREGARRADHIGE